MLRLGTTTAEVKSGYGLSLAAELKQLRAIRRAAESHAVDVVPTLLAAHEFPPEYRDDRDAWVDEIVDEIVPACAEAGLARFCDVFCERGVFDVDQSRRVLEAGAEHGLLPRLHADEFVDSGGAGLAAELGAVSADHLVAVSAEGIEAMAAAGVMAVLLPGVSFFLMKARLRAGAAVDRRRRAGGAGDRLQPRLVAHRVAAFRRPTGGLPDADVDRGVPDRGDPERRLLPRAGRGDRHVEVGKRADLALLDAPNLLHLGYHIGVNPVRAVVKGGRVVHRVA